MILRVILKLHQQTNRRAQIVNLICWATKLFLMYYSSYLVVVTEANPLRVSPHTTYS
jgi:hypothetical protein